MTLKEVMADPSVRFFTKRILTQCQECDPVDALNDLELALVTWRAETDRLLAVDKFAEALQDIAWADDDRDILPEVKDLSI